MSTWFGITKKELPKRVRWLHRHWVWKIVLFSPTWNTGNKSPSNNYIWEYFRFRYRTNQKYALNFFQVETHLTAVSSPHFHGLIPVHALACKSRDLQGQAWLPGGAVEPGINIPESRCVLEHLWGYCPAKAPCCNKRSYETNYPLSDILQHKSGAGAMTTNKVIWCLFLCSVIIITWIKITVLLQSIHFERLKIKSVLGKYMFVMTVTLLGQDGFVAILGLIGRWAVSQH